MSKAYWWLISTKQSQPTLTNHWAGLGWHGGINPFDLIRLDVCFVLLMLFRELYLPEPQSTKGMKKCMSKSRQMGKMSILIWTKCPFSIFEFRQRGWGCNSIFILAFGFLSALRQFMVFRSRDCCCDALGIWTKVFLLCRLTGGTGIHWDIPVGMLSE